MHHAFNIEYKICFIKCQSLNVVYDVAYIEIIFTICEI